eukprot:scaffold1723_cov104-Isochrysis_galbana.AAC.13
MARMAALPAALSGAPDDRCPCVRGPAKAVASSGDCVAVWPSAVCVLLLLRSAARLRETAPRPTSDDVGGHVHASLDRGRRPRRHAKCAISDTHVLRQGLAGRMQPAAALWSCIAARGGGRSAPIDASGEVSAERKLTGYCPLWSGKELAAFTVPA